MTALESATESSVTEEGNYQYQLTETLRAMTDRLAALSIPAPAPQPDPKPRVKPRSPDPFDGSDPSKLEIFIFQCSMYITLREHDFPDETERKAAKKARDPEMARRLWELSAQLTGCDWPTESR